MVSDLVSYLIPAFNHERYVRKCLDSVLEDAHDSKEIIIIDDGSTDRTSQVISEWIAENSTKIKVVFVSRENKGIASTLNELSSLASGAYWRLGASDDYFLPAGTAWLVSYLHQNPRKTIVFGDSIVVGENNELIHQSAMKDLHGANKSKYLSEKSLAESMISNWAISGPVALIRSDQLSLLKWDDSLRIDDWDFFLKRAADGSIGFIDRAVCAYRLHGSNTCRTQDVSVRVKNLVESVGVAERNIPHFKTPDRKRLQAQILLIRAKISYLKRDWVAMAIYLMRWVLAKIRLKSVDMVRK